MQKSTLYRIFFGMAIALLVAGIAIGAGSAAKTASFDPLQQVQKESQVSVDNLTLNDVTPLPTPKPPVDHSAFPVLQQEFATPQDVTKACLSCHDDAAMQIQHTTHWTWEFVNETTGQVLGKKHLINDFCIDVNSNEPRCTSCHVGYGWKDKNFDFSVQENVDCLVCHDTTGEYKKFPAGAGLPVSEPKEFPSGSGKIWEPPNLSKIAQSIGYTSRDTCGSCHFYGGGGDEVKHGDLDSSLKQPDRNLDVHMAVDGANFTCTTCHQTEEHNIPGSRYSMDPNQWKGCEDCHTDSPHKLDVLNKHAQKVACQTCHIPEFARGGIATKMWWDWSKAGQFNPDGSKIVEKDENGNDIYNTLKGEFIWEENVIPDYVWFNGEVSYTLLGDKIDPSKVVPINQFHGDLNDPNSKIWPVKHFRGKQPYDKVNSTLVVPHLFGKDDAAYWGNFDWGKAIQFGMDYVGEPYSGEYDFVETEMFWPITHMVAPADQALTCNDCHTTKDGRLDFAALGYSEDDVHRLTNFPPTLQIELLDAPHNSPEYCSSCHEEQFNLWKDSHHGEKGVGCVSCHQPEGEGEHPAIALTMDKSAEVCGACHLDEYNDWQNSEHAKVTGHDQITCVDCHEVHAQTMRLTDNYQTPCENCHKDQANDFMHSTHNAENLNCIDCHKNTDNNTGHEFVVASDTCIKCHGDDIHKEDAIVKLQSGAGAETSESTPGEDVIATEQPGEKEQGKGIVVNIPGWGYILIGGAAGGGLYWVFAGSEPGERHDEEANEETTDFAETSSEEKEAETSGKNGELDNRENSEDEEV